MPLTEMHEQLKKYFNELQAKIERDNEKLELLRELIGIDNPRVSPSISKLQRAALECVQNNGGHADLASIREYMEAKDMPIDKPKLSVALTKCPQLHFNRSKRWWESTSKNAARLENKDSLPNIHH